MPIVKHAVIAAAGLGSRLGHGKPKCLEKFDNVTIIEHLLSLLADVPDVRVVVGFMEAEVIQEVARLRPDAIIVRNSSFRTTTTLHSYTIGSKGIHGDCLFMDADLLIVPETFHTFISGCQPSVARLALTKAKTNDAVFVDLEGNKVVGFRRDDPTEWEWSNVSWLPVSIFNDIGNTAVYEHLINYLPISSAVLDSWEIDTLDDFDRANKMRHLFMLGKRNKEGFRRASD